MVTKTREKPWANSFWGYSTFGGLRPELGGGLPILIPGKAKPQFYSFHRYYFGFSGSKDWSNFLGFAFSLGPRGALIPGGLTGEIGGSTKFFFFNPTLKPEGYLVKPFWVGGNRGPNFSSGWGF